MKCSTRATIGWDTGVQVRGAGRGRIGNGSVWGGETRTRRRAGGEHHQVNHVRTSAGDAPLHVRGQGKNAALKLVWPLIPDKHDPLAQASFAAPPAMSSAVPPPPPFPLGKFGLNSSPVRPHSLPVSVPLHRGPLLNTPHLPPMFFVRPSPREMDPRSLDPRLV